MMTLREENIPLKGHKDTVIAIKMNCSKDLIATGSMDSTVKIWDINGNLKFELND